MPDQDHVAPARRVVWGRRPVVAEGAALPELYLLKPPRAVTAPAKGASAQTQGDRSRAGHHDAGKWQG